MKLTDNISGNINKDKPHMEGLGETFHLCVIMVFIIVMIAMVSTWQSGRIEMLRREIEVMENKLSVMASLKQ